MSDAPAGFTQVTPDALPPGFRPKEQMEFQKPDQFTGQVSAQTRKGDLVDPLSKQIQESPFRALQLPFEALGNVAGEAHDKLADQMLSDAAKGKGVPKTDYLKSFLLGSGRDASNMAAGALSPTGIATGVATAVAPEVMGPALIAHGALGVAENTPGAIKGNPDAMQGVLSSAAEATGGATVTGGAYGTRNTPIQETWKANRNTLHRLTGAMQTPQEAAQLPAGSSFAPARAVSNLDVMKLAEADGIDLTPAQFSKDKVAQMIQAQGEQTLTPGGKPFQDSLELNRGKLEQGIENFARRHDPYALGNSPESAGDALKTSAKVALEVAKDNANIAYKQAGIDQANIAVDVKTPLQKFVDSQRMVRQPGAAVTQPEYKSPAVEAALKDIESKINDPRLGPNSSVQSARNLRTEFWEKANDYSGTIPDAAKGIYKMASQIPDDAMMSAAKGTPFEQSFRDASSQWSALKSKFDTPGEPLNKLLQTSDSKQAYNSIVGGKSADVIQKLKAEKIDLAPIQSQVVRDIAGKGFRATGNTLAGYPDSFLQQLFGPDATKELYTRAEMGRRLNLEANSSGSGRLLISKEQLGWNPASWVRGEAAAQASMPRAPNSFVSPTRPAPASYSSLSPKMLSLRALSGATGISATAEQGR
jgi:hypothetical protein